MKKKYLVYAIAPIIAATLISAGVASAHGSLLFGGHGFGGFFGGNATPEEVASHQTAMFQNQASLLGISVDEVKNVWAQGKTLWELAQEKGITESELQTKMKEARSAQLKSHLATLVEKGVITQAQADQRLTFMQNNAGKGKGGRGFRGMHGMGMMGF